MWAIESASCWPLIALYDPDIKHVNRRCVSFQSRVDLSCHIMHQAGFTADRL